MCLWHAVVCLCIQVESSKQFFMCSLQSDSSSSAMSATISFLFPFLLFSCRLSTLPLLPYLFSLMFVILYPAMYHLPSVKLFNHSIITCIWPYLTSFHLIAGQQPEGGQCAQTVDHRSPRASSQETLLLRALFGRHAVCTHHQQAPHRHRFLGRALWIQQPASRPQPTPSSIQRNGQEETQGDKEICRVTCVITK